MRLFALPILLLAASPAFAAATAWQEVAPGARARLITSDVREPDGTTLAGLEIDMPMGTKTYWRVPGETGIPTTLDLAGSTGIAGHEMLWPYPAIDTSTGYVDFVYWGPTVLPLRLSLSSDAPSLSLSVIMGICSDICVPAQASFVLPLQFTAPDAGQGLRLRQAVANVPLPADDADAVGELRFDAAAESLALALHDTGIDPASVIATAEDESLLFGAPKKSPDTGLIVFPLLGGSAENGLAGQPVRITYMTANGPFEVTRMVASAQSTPGGQ